ncbi:Hypothetical predicted protein [Cloeon dipterum]|nr:Hypothetical predicted protein [Cloeon dipterum]
MGSSTKKHKSDKTRDSRKRKHRSRSKSPETSERSDRQDRHRHRRHHRRRSDKNDKNEHYSSEDEVSAPAAPPPPKLSRESTTPPPAPTISSGSNSEALSIDDTNKLRAKLGLKPLKVDDGDGGEKSSGPKKTAAELMGGKDMGEFVHRAPENLGAKAKAEKLRQKLKDRRDKREIDNKLRRIKGLGDESSDDDAVAWVNKSRKIQDEKAQAAKRAKMLEEMDEEFGVGELVHDEFQHARRQAYTAKDLRGLKVQHDLEALTEDRQVILTLEDKGVLDEEDDVLVNVNLKDDEKYKKNNERKKQNKTGYSAYDDEQVDKFGNIEKSLLGKYDEEIDGEKRQSFVIGTESDELERREYERKIIQAKLQKKTLETLATPGLVLASEYYTKEEMFKFKKPKKVRKIRKRVLKASDLEGSAPSTSADLGRRKREEAETSSGFKPVDRQEEQKPQASSSKQEELEEMEMDSDSEDKNKTVGFLDYDDLPPPEVDLSDVRLDPDEGELELQLALNKARKLKQIKDLKPTKRIEDIAMRVAQIKQEQEGEEVGSGGHNIMLNATAEFCRTLGDIPTYGMAGNRDENVDELMDYDPNDGKKTTDDDKEVRGTWNEVEVDDTPVDILPPEAPILEEEPDVGSGVAGALRLAVSKGYLEKETSNKPSNSRMNHLQAQNYSIDDKNYIEDDKHSRRERFNGPTSDFREKDGYKPNIKLEYIDDDGKILNEKEAFRYLSHKFHGKGPGKNKVEKRIKKMEQEALMKQMNSTDTPLGTVTMLQQKQKETHCPYVVLSGSKQLTS